MDSGARGRVRRYRRGSSRPDSPRHRVGCAVLLVGGPYQSAPHRSDRDCGQDARHVPGSRGDAEYTVAAGWTRRRPAGRVAPTPGARPRLPAPAKAVAPPPRATRIRTRREWARSLTATTHVGWTRLGDRWAQT